MYPELANVNKSLMTEPLPKVFDKWIRDNIDRENNEYYLDTSPFRDQSGELRDNFEPERFIKNPLDIAYCEQILKQSFKFF